MLASLCLFYLLQETTLPNLSSLGSLRSSESGSCGSISALRAAAAVPLSAPLARRWPQRANTLPAAVPARGERPRRQMAATRLQRVLTAVPSCSTAVLQARTRRRRPDRSLGSENWTDGRQSSVAGGACSSRPPGSRVSVCAAGTEPGEQRCHLLSVAR